MADHELVHPVIPSGLAKDWKVSKIMLQPASLGLEFENNKTNSAAEEKEESEGSASEKGFLFSRSHAPCNIPLDSDSISTSRTQSKHFCFIIYQCSPNFA